MMNIIMKYTMIMLLIAVNTQSWVHAGNTVVGTQFTYQGELLDNGSPANGSYDLLIQLYAINFGGSPIDFVSIQDLQVSNGLLSVELDYGDLPFNGDEMFLQINVRPGVSTGNFESLNPRQRINATPYAIQAEFTENGGSPWLDISGGITYGQDVILGNAATNTSSMLTIDSLAGQSPLRAKINGTTKLMVNENGGTQVGTVGTVTPSNPDVPVDGLRVQGDAAQNLGSHGFVKAATLIQCGAGINGASESFFNNINDNDFTTTQNGAAGGCSITVPFDVSNAFLTVSAHALGGVNPFETVVGSCSAFSSTQLNCQLHSISGATTSLVNGVIQLLIY